MKKLFGIIVLSLLLSGNAYAECISGNCINGYGVKEFELGKKGKYEGNFKKGKMHGQGKYTWYEDGNIYTGEFKKDKIHGRGKLVKGDGMVWEGKFRRGDFVKGDEYRTNAASNNNGTSGTIEFTTSIGKHKNTCKELGFTPGTEKFGDCALKLIELEVAQQGNNKAAQQIQIVQQEAPYDGWMGELGLSILRGDFSRKTQQPAYRFPVQQKSVCRFQNNGFAQPTLNCTTR